jgi:hypothetical protein
MSRGFKLIFLFFVITASFLVIRAAELSAKISVKGVRKNYALGYSGLLLLTLCGFKKRRIYPRIKESILLQRFDLAGGFLFLESGVFLGFAKTFWEGFLINLLKKEEEDLTRVNKKIFPPLVWLLGEEE